MDLYLPFFCGCKLDRKLKVGDFEMHQCLGMKDVIMQI